MTRHNTKKLLALMVLNFVHPTKAELRKPNPDLENISFHSLSEAYPALGIEVESDEGVWTHLTSPEIEEREEGWLHISDIKMRDIFVLDDELKEIIT